MLCDNCRTPIMPGTRHRATYDYAGGGICEVINVTIEEVLSTLDESVPQSVARVHDLVMREQGKALNDPRLVVWVTNHRQAIEWWYEAGKPS